MSKFKTLPDYFTDADSAVTSDKAETVTSEIDAHEFDPPSAVNFPLRVNTYQHELIKRGSSQLGVTMVQFVRDASVEYAKKLGLH